MENSKKISIHDLFWYFLIFSVIGLILETVYCYITSGVIESRKGLLWGPFCPVYGVCGAFLIFVLYKLNCNTIPKLFVAGFVFGSIGEYILSYGLEAVYGMRFWDYNYLSFNLNGRISLIFSFYWGVLSVVLVKWVKPLIDRLISKIKLHIRNILEIGIFIFLCIDCVMTIWAIQTYQNRVVFNKTYEAKTDNILSSIRANIENNYFTNERISHTFPNLRIKNEKGEEVWVVTLLDKDEEDNPELEK